MSVLLKKTSKKKVTKKQEITPRPSVIEFNDKSSSYTESYPRGVSFVVLGKDYKPVSQIFTCKDYLQEVGYNLTIGNIKNPIYGFKLTQEQVDEIRSLDKLMLVLTSKVPTPSDSKVNYTSLNALENIKRLMHPIEDALGFKQMELYYTNNGVDIILEISKEWAQQPYTMGTLSLLLHMGITYDVDSLEDYVQRGQCIEARSFPYIKKMMEWLPTMLKYGIQPYRTWESYQNGASSEDANPHNSGVMSSLGLTALYNNLKQTKECVA